MTVLKAFSNSVTDHKGVYVVRVDRTIRFGEKWLHWENGSDCARILIGSEAFHGAFPQQWSLLSASRQCVQFIL